MVYGGITKFTPMCFKKEKHRMKTPSWGTTSVAPVAVFAVRLGSVSSLEIVDTEAAGGVSERGKGICSTIGPSPSMIL